MASKRKPNITSEVVDITPEMAEEWYIMSGGNRPLRNHHVAFLGQQMADKKWELNGEPIIFDWNGKLIEGHHRLYASQEYKVPFQSLVVRGVDPDAKQTINTGRSRSQGDALSFSGVEKHHALLSTTVMRLIEYDLGRMNNPAAIKVSNSEIVAAFDKYPGLADCVESTNKVRKIMTQSRYLWFYYLVAKKHRKYADDFTQSLVDGVELAQDSPILQLRMRIMNSSSKSRMSLSEEMAITVKAWNLYFKDRPCRALRWSRAEGFPKVEGV